MTGVIRGATEEAVRRLRELEERTRRAQALFGAGMAEIAGGVGIALAMKPALDAFVELEDAGARMKSSLLQAGNFLPTEDYERLSKLAVRLGDELPGTTSNFYDMFTKMRQLGVETETILAGAGESAAHLAVVLGLPFEQTSVFVAKLKEATGVADSELNGFIDTIARTANMGVKTDEMMLAFGRSSPALKTLGIQGAEASKSIAALYAMMIKGGLSGETTGTNMMALLNQLMDSGKMAEMNGALAKLGQSPLNFVDTQTGEFLGVENMIAQFDKLGNLNPQQISDIVTAGFGPGMDAGIVKIMASAGIKGFNAMQESMNKQATLGDKVNVQLSTLSAQWEATTGAWGNTMATMFEPMGKALTPIVAMLGNAASAIGRFAEANPEMFKIVGILASVASGLLIVSGAIKVVRAGILMMNVAAMMNPIGLIIAAVVAAAALIYTYWGPISGFFIGIWEKIKGPVMAVINFLKNLFLNFTPAGFVIRHWNVIGPFFKSLWDLVVVLVQKAIGIMKFLFLNFTPAGLIVKHWSTLSEFFQKVFDNVTGVIGKALDFIRSLLQPFFEAGSKIVTMIADGILAGVSKVTEAIGKVTKAARDYLPFSPAKQGAFRDLHKVKIVETIAGAINAGPLTRAMSGVTARAAAVASPVAVGSAGGFNYSPTITINGAQNTSDFKRELDKHKDEIIRIFERSQQRKDRLRY